MKRPNLILLPFAGGSFYSYKALEQHLVDHVNTIPVELPGRGIRVSEQLLYDIDELSAEVFHSILPVIQSAQPYSLFGHSMGALLLFLVTRKILQEQLPPPHRLFVSGRPGPRIHRFTQKDRDRLQLSAKPFMREVISMGGTPRDIGANKALINFFEPILRADFTAISTFVYPGPLATNIPVIIFKGKNENFDLEDALQWQHETSVPVTIHSFEGGHFFIFDQPQAVAAVIVRFLIDQH